MIFADFQDEKNCDRAELYCKLFDTAECAVSLTIAEQFRTGVAGTHWKNICTPKDSKENPDENSMLLLKTQRTREQFFD